MSTGIQTASLGLGGAAPGRPTLRFSGRAWRAADRGRSTANCAT
jgi:hypothetical protein